jgi:hypothetical protein
MDTSCHCIPRECSCQDKDCIYGHSSPQQPSTPSPNQAADSARASSSETISQDDPGHEGLIHILNETIHHMDQQNGVLTNSISRLEKRVSDLEGKLSNLTSSTDKGSSDDVEGASQEERAGAKAAPNVHINVSAPVIEPAGGLFPGPVIVRMQSLPGEFIFFTKDGSIPTVNSTLYCGPFALLAGSDTLIGAVAVEISDEADEELHVSNVTWAHFQVQACAMKEPDCCRWQDALSQFEALMQSFLWRNKTLNDMDTLQAQREKEIEKAWLDSEANYLSAKIRHQKAVRGASIAVQFTQSWERASNLAKQHYAIVRMHDAGDKSEINMERALIMEILAMIDNLRAENQAQKATDIGRIQTRMHQLGLVAPEASLNANALDMLTSSFSGRSEVDDVREILENMLNDTDSQADLIAQVL